MTAAVAIAVIAAGGRSGCHISPAGQGHVTLVTIITLSDIERVNLKFTDLDPHIKKLRPTVSEILPSEVGRKNEPKNKVFWQTLDIDTEKFEMALKRFVIKFFENFRAAQSHSPW